MKHRRHTLGAISALAFLAVLGVAAPAAAFDPADPLTDTPSEAFWHGYHAVEAGDLNEALPAFDFAAAGGEVRALWQLAQMYLNGDGVPADTGRALGYYRDITCNSDTAEAPAWDIPYIADAYLALGDYFHGGTLAFGTLSCPDLLGFAPAPAAPEPAPFRAVGAAQAAVSKDVVGSAIDQAREYFWLAATELGDPRAQSELARMFYAGEMGPADPAQAMLWARQASDQGDASAQGLVGHLLFEGEGVPQQIVLGLAYLQIAFVRTGSDDPEIQRWHEDAFGLAEDRERRQAMRLANDWLEDNYQPFR